MPAPVATAVAVAGLAITLSAVHFVATRRPALAPTGDRQAVVLRRGVAPLVLGVILLTLGWAWLGGVGPTTLAATTGGYILTVLALAVVVRLTRAGRPRRSGPVLLLETVRFAGAMALVALPIWLIAGLDVSRAAANNPEGIRPYATVATPLLLSLALLVGALFLGLMGTAAEDQDREWWSRFSAWVLIFAAGWLGLHAVALYPQDAFVGAGSIREWLVVAAGGVSGLVTAVLGFSGLTAGAPSANAPNRVRPADSTCSRRRPR